MDLRDRLNVLTSISKAESKGDEEKQERLRELRRQLERVLEPRKVYRRREGTPIEALVPGRVVSTPLGETFLSEGTFPLDFRCGEMDLCQILSIPTYPAHLLSRDERLRDFDLRKALFLDTETTGLAGGTGTVAFMVGLGFFEGEGFTVHQLFMRDYSEERALLSLLQELLGRFEFLVTFNGRYYDVPLLETRCILSRVRTRISEMAHFDLLPPSRKIWKGAYENCRLVTLESKLLGMGREDDIPSEWIPYLYFDYIQSGDARKIHRVFYHNRMDILAMVGLVGRIHLVYHDPGAARPRKGVEHFALGRLFWDHGFLDRAIVAFETALKRCDDDLAWEVMRWLSRAFRKTGQFEKARSLWEEMASWPSKRDSFPYVELAKYYEHRVKDVGKALDYVRRALAETPTDRFTEIELLHRRRRRLQGKLSLGTMASAGSPIDRIGGRKEREPG